MPPWSRAFIIILLINKRVSVFLFILDSTFTFTKTPRHSKFFQRDHLRSAVGIICGPRIVCGPIWGSFAVGDHLRSRDHLRRCTGLPFKSNYKGSVKEILNEYIADINFYLRVFD